MAPVSAALFISTIIRQRELKPFLPSTALRPVLATRPGVLSFFGNATANSATIINSGAQAEGANGGYTSFGENAGATDSILISNGGAVSGAAGGITQWLSTASPASSTFTSNGGVVSGALGGATYFGGNTDNATFIANSGSGGGNGGGIILTSGTTGTSRVEVFGNGGGLSLALALTCLPLAR